MICKKCGRIIEDDALFCPACGINLAAHAEQHVIPEEKLSDAAETVSETVAEIKHEAVDSPEIPHPSDINAISLAKDDPVIPTDNVTYEEDKTVPATMPVKTEMPEKGFFGVGAFILCLCVIGLLAASAGVFAALYFTAIGG